MLFVEKIIEWGKKKGYDDFYLTKVVSNIVTRYIPSGIIMALFLFLFLFIGILFALAYAGINPTWVVIIYTPFIIPGGLVILPLIILYFCATIGNTTLENQEKKGIREDIREAAFWQNSMAKFAIKVIRNVPKHCNWLFRISVIISILISVLIFRDLECEWREKSFFLASLVLYFLVIESGYCLKISLIVKRE